MDKAGVAITFVQVIKKLLIEDKVDINVKNEVGETPLHTLVRRAAGKKTAGTFNCLWNFLVYCNKDFKIDIKSGQHGDTALHIAAEVGTYMLTTIFITILRP